MPRINNFFFSLRSITWPAYKASDTAGITSLRPINPIANGALVKLYIHQPNKVVSMRNAITKANLPVTRKRNSGIRIEIKGEISDCVFCESVFAMNAAKIRMEILLCCQLLKVQVSDTTGDATSTTAGYKKSPNKCSGSFLNKIQGVIHVSIKCQSRCTQLF